MEAIRAGKILEPYGWLNSLFGVANDNVFKINEHDPIESVKRANVLRVLTYLSWKNAVNDCKIIHTELLQEKQKREQKRRK